MRSIPAIIYNGLHDQKSVMDATEQFLGENPDERISLSHEASEVLGHTCSALPNMVANKLSNHNEKFGATVVY